MQSSQCNSVIGINKEVYSSKIHIDLSNDMIVCEVFVSKVGVGVCGHVHVQMRLHMCHVSEVLNWHISAFASVHNILPYDF